MIKRTIFGFVLLAIFILSFTLKLFPLLLVIILILGLAELIRLFAKNPLLISCYGLIFISAMLIATLMFFKNPTILFLSILVIIFNDSWAYLIGRIIGRTHFCKISPNKTIEGLVGGVIGTITLLFIVSIFVGPGMITAFDSNHLKLPSLIIIILFCGLGVCGDIFESWFKRKLEIKDTSHLLGEQGGILDRVDSWSFTMIALLILFF